MRVPFKIRHAVAQNQKFRRRFFARPVAALHRHYAIGIRIEAVAGEAEAVLQAVRRQNGCDVLRVAQPHDERDDRLRRNRIEAGRRGIIQHDRGTIHESARDRNAAAHAAGQFIGELVRGFLQLNEAKRFVYALVNRFVGDALFIHAEGDIFADGKGIEQRAFLKHESELAPELVQLLFGE